MTSRVATSLLAVFVLIGICRIVITYHITAQGFDEPAHVACGIEWLDHGTYKLDPLHPPLSRIFIGLPLYLSGARLPAVPATDSVPAPFWIVGNEILNRDGEYLKNLALARSGILPFFVLASLVVFFWTRRNHGNLAAVIAVAVFTTTPIVLAFSSLAYTDFPTAATQLLAMFAFAIWLETRTISSAVWLGVALGLAILSKFTSLLFLPFAGLAIASCKLLSRDTSSETRVSQPILQLVTMSVIAAVLVWGGYRFSIDRLDEGMNLSAQAMPSFQHFPGPIASFSRTLVALDPIVPTPSFLRGIAESWVMNAESADAYLLGKQKAGGWWYFFLVGMVVKTPLPFLILAMVGFFSILHARQWKLMAPGAAAVAILLVTMLVKRDAGLRHVLVVFPLLAVTAGHAGAQLWRHSLQRVALVILLCWQGVASITARNDYIAYFNELAPNPRAVLITGCDLDCGQDMLRLSHELAQRGILKINLAAWTTAELTHLGLPDFHLLQPSERVTGWVAISARSQVLGDAFHTSYGPNAFAWLSNYQPVAQIGQTIRLYYIPEDEAHSAP